MKTPHFSNRTENTSPSRSLRRAAVLAVSLAILAGFSLLGQTQDKETVGAKPQAREVLPVGQVVTPYGLQSYLPGLRPQALALSPDGKLLAVIAFTVSIRMMRKRLIK